MATPFVWTTRCIPAWSVCLVTILLLASFVKSPYGKSEPGKHHGEATMSQNILATYTVFLHVCSVLFTLRVCWSMRSVLRKMKEAAEEIPCRRRRRTLSIKNDSGIVEFPLPLFPIIIPAYKEEMATLQETLRVLASHVQARQSYHVYLAMEVKEEKALSKAASLCETFEKSFFRMSFTMHPSDIPGEAQGKSSNEAWAAKQIMEDYPDERVRQNTIITTMDADTHLSSRYFTQLTRLHIEFPDTNTTTIYVPPLVFDRNLHRVPLFVRTADMMWGGAGLSSMYAGSTVAIPTSVYSLPMTLVEQVGGWDTMPGAIGEDMHMYLKCFFALSGNLTVQKVFAAASQCNVSSDEKGISGWYRGLEARYKQALRHMWGALDSGFAVRETMKMVERHRVASREQADIPLSAPNSNWTAFYTSSGLHKSLDAKLEDSPAPLKPINITNVIVLFHRLFEAHFLPIHLAVILTCSAIYTSWIPAFLVPSTLKIALDISGFLRLIGWSMMICFFFLYERYHRLCVALRKEEMRLAGMLEEMEEHDGFTDRVFQIAGLFETALFPIGGFIFGAIPALQAVLSHLFTDRLTYVVSLKPSLALAKIKDISRMAP